MNPRSVCGAKHPWLTDAESRPLVCTRDRGHPDNVRSVGHPVDTEPHLHECEIAPGATIAWME